MKKKNKGDKRKIERVHDSLSIIDNTLLDNSIQAAVRDARFAAWSTQGKAMLLHLAATTPRFSVSKKVAIYVERGLKHEYPELWVDVKKQLNKDVKKKETGI